MSTVIKSNEISNELFQSWRSSNKTRPVPSIELPNLPVAAREFWMAATLLSASPPIVFTTTTNIHYIGDTGVSTLRTILSGCSKSKFPPTFLIRPTWHLPHVFRDSPDIINILREVQSLLGIQGVIILCNDSDDMAACHQAGVIGVEINTNCLVDETVFQCWPLQEKSYDAIYIAKLNEFKRHSLARKINRLALIYAPTTGHEVGVFEEMLRSFPTASFLNGDPRTNEYIYLDRAETAKVIQRSQVGLCLSEIEGAMYASIEYLLCGVPIVSTSNKGGRNSFMHEEYWMECDADANSVAESVSRMIDRNLSPDLVRGLTLLRIQKLRSDLSKLVQGLQFSFGLDPIWSTDWHFVRQHHGGLKFQSINTLCAPTN